VRIFDVQGKNLCQVMHLNESETLRDRRECDLCVAELRPHVIMEGFNHGSIRDSNNRLGQSSAT
jgi:hypothetical protein